jgi:hypothetical protein
MQHDNSISIIRVTAMLMIIFYHCLCYNAGIWPFHNPIVYTSLEIAVIHNIATVGLDAFVFISGLLYYRIDQTGKYNNNGLFLKNKTERLLVPYFVWGVAQCFIFYGRQDPKELLGGIAHLWFLLMLFEVFVTVCITKRIWQNANKVQDAAIFCSLITLEIIADKTGIFPKLDQRGHVLLCLQQTVNYLPIFFIGMLTDKYKPYKKLNINGFVLLAVIIVMFAVGCVSRLYHLRLTRLYMWAPPFLLVLSTYALCRKNSCIHILGGGNPLKILLFADR